MLLTERIQYVANMKGLTFAGIERELGFSNGSIRKWDKNSPSIDKVKELANFLSVSVAWLVDEDGMVHRNNLDVNINSAEAELLYAFQKLEEKDKMRVLERTQTLLDLKEAAEKEVIREEISEPAIIKHPAILPAEEPEEPEEEVSTIEMMVFDQKASAGLGNYLVEDTSYEMLSFNEDEVPDRADFGVRIKGDSMEPHISDGSIVWVREQVQIENGQVGIFILNEEDAYCKKLYIDHDKHEVFLLSYNPEYPPMKIGKEDFLRTVGLVL